MGNQFSPIQEMVYICVFEKVVLPGSLTLSLSLPLSEFFVFISVFCRFRSAQIKLPVAPAAAS